MKKKLICFAMLLVMMVTFSACTKKIDYSKNLEDYILTDKYHDNYNILQLTDIHWNVNTSTKSSMIYLDKLFEEVNNHIVLTQGVGAKIDLVEITGDMFMLANRYHLNTFIKYFEEKAIQYGFMYAPIWGNHDRHSLYNPNTLSKLFTKAPHCLYLEINDNLYGRSNYIINLTTDGTKNSEVAWMIANLDSGASFSETELATSRYYDYIRSDQTDWFLKEHALAGEGVPAIAYYHIPQDENEKVWKSVFEDGEVIKNKFFRLEEFADNGLEEYASDFIDLAKDHNLKGAFMGHAHNNDWTYEYDGVVIGLGVKTGSELYFAHIDINSTDLAMQMGLASVGITENFDLIGASLVTLKDTNGSFDLEHLYYNERANGDFIAWVKW